MGEFKNLKVSLRTHEMLAARAEALGMKKYALADAALLWAMNLKDHEIQKFVVNAQLKPPTGYTSPEDPKEKP